MTKLDKFLQQQRFSKIDPWLRRGCTLLDIGCHRGEMLLHFSDKIANGIGIDPLVAGTKLAPHLQTIHGHFPENLSAQQTFDAITALAVLEHIPMQHQPLFFRSCAQLLKPGGLLLLTVPAPQVDMLLVWLKKLRLVKGMSSEQHYGYAIGHTIPTANAAGLKLVKHQRFQAGLNNLFVFTPHTL